MGLHELVAQLRDAYFLDRRMAFYVAAGISKDCPTHLPLGEELKQAVILGFFEMENARDLTLLREAVKRRTLEEVCGVIQHELEDKRQLIVKMAQVLDSNEIIANHNHRFLARALHDGHLVVTTNYDAMVERAYYDLYGSAFPTERICYDRATFERFLRQSQIQAFRRGSNELGWLLKLHGTFHVSDKETGYSVMTTLDRVGRGLPPTAQEVLIQVLRNSPLVVLGYGCMDIDIVYPVLIGTSSSQPIWWIKHSDGRTHIYDYGQLKGVLKEEEKKSARDVDMYLHTQTLNILRVLCKRGDQNEGRVWQINALTSQVILAAMAQIGGNFGASIKRCARRVNRWADGLRQLGVEASDVERLLVLAKLAQVCGPYKSDSRDIYDLSNELFQAALKKVRDDTKKARIYQEMGWNKYRQDPEKNTDQAVELYDKAEKLLLGAVTSLMPRVTMIRGLRALAYRRARRIVDALRAAEEAWISLPSFLRNGDIPSEPEVLRTFLKSKGIEDSDFGPLGSVLRRVAAVYDQCVSGPDTLATAIRCKHQWKMHERQTRALRRARRLLETDRTLQQLAGEPIQKIQSENQLGLVCSKLREGATARAVHEDSRRVAGQFSRPYEYAQALRNRALAEEVAGNLGKAISSLKEAMELFEERPRDLHATLWHLGRIRIKNKDESGLGDIERHLVDPSNNWHWKANDHALLGIGYFDIKDDPVAARQHFALMMEQYPKEDNALNNKAFKNQAYGVDNALANVVAAIERLCKDSAAEAVVLRTELTSLREQLERLRSEALKSLPF